MADEPSRRYLWEYLFVAIDRATRRFFVPVYNSKAAAMRVASSATSGVPAHCVSAPFLPPFGILLRNTLSGNGQRKRVYQPSVWFA
ncbi:MAG: hypothetical protein ACJA1E_001366 [Paracoccaceae bacterium]|jgi:hypothetical protein